MKTKLSFLFILLGVSAIFYATLIYLIENQVLFRHQKKYQTEHYQVLDWILNQILGRIQDKNLDKVLDRALPGTRLDTTQDIRSGMKSCLNIRLTCSISLLDLESVTWFNRDSSRIPHNSSFLCIYQIMFILNISLEYSCEHLRNFDMNEHECS